MKVLKITRKNCRHAHVDSLVASYECCKIEGSWPRALVDRLFHRTRLVGLDCRNRVPSSASWNCVKVFWTAHIVEAGLWYRPREVICHTKDVTTILCHLSTVPE